MIKSLTPWVCAAGVVTMMCGLLYVGIQQALRASANDPQIQIAEDIAATLSGGVDPRSFQDAERESVDIATSLAPHLMIFDDAGNNLVSGARLHGEVPKIPAGVFAYVKNHGEDRITWQPEKGVRSALVVTRYQNQNTSGFVAVGRSLRETEKRIEQIAIMIGAGWAAMMMLIAIGFFLTTSRVRL